VPKQSPTPDPEEIILDAYFGAAHDQSLVEAAIQVFEVEGDECYYTRLQAAAATVLLRRIADRLPQWACVGDGTVVLGRKKTKRAKSPHKPKYLFEVNWADSGPGFSWPTAYHVVVVPRHDRAVVIASADCPDTFGFVDMAIGHFPADRDLCAGSKEIIVADWTRLAGDGQGRWAYLFGNGLVDAETANTWADEVWPECDDDDESKEEDDNEGETEA